MVLMIITILVSVIQRAHAAPIEIAIGRARSALMFEPRFDAGSVLSPFYVANLHRVEPGC